MATVTVLRPSATSSGVGWTAEPSGTLHGVTSDDNDATAAEWSGDGSALILQTPIDSPPAGERRHLVRLRARGEDGAAWWAVRLASGSLVAGAAGNFGASPETVAGSWGAGAPPDGSTILSTYVTGQTDGVRIVELYIDVDSRLAPTFTPQVLDGAGSSTTTVSDTATPTIRASAVDLDGLTARQFRYWVTLDGATVWDTGIVSGPPSNRVTTPLANGDYVANLQIWSTLGTNTAYASAVEQLAFTLAVGEIATPDAPTVTPEAPFYRVEVCGPDASEFDDYVSYIEVQRVDCPLGGYLFLPGTAGHASAPDVPDTVLYDWDTDVEGWVGEGSTTVQRVTDPTHDGAGALEATMTMGAGFAELRFNDAAGPRDLSANGPTFGAWVLIPADAPGVDWQARMELQNDAFGWVPGPNFNPTPGEWTLITYTPDPALLADCRALGFAIGATDVNATQSIYVDTLVQGTLPFVDPPTDLEVTISARRDDGWRPAGDETLVAKYTTTGDNRSWRVSLDADGGGDPARAGRPYILWSPDGTLASAVSAFADERAPIDPDGRVTLRVFLDTDNGAGGWTVTFETMDETGAWVPLGNPVSGSGTTSLDVNSVNFTVGGYNAGGAERFTGRVYSLQIRDGRTGPLMVDTDFTSQVAGDPSFTDDLGNVWTIHPPAELVSSQTVTTVAMLGPLETDECAEWVDYTLPRSGQGRTCDHQPEPCCSYYRARTVARVDGSLLVSNWSDGWNPGIPRGLIFAWPGEVGDIPAGWDRVTALDGRYPKGIPNTITQPGLTGGSASHTHTTPGHTHPMDHTHIVTNTVSGAAVGTFNGSDGVVGTQGYPASHTHTTTPNTNASSGVVSGSASPGTSAVSNDPSRLEVVWIESDGNPLGVPPGGLGLMPDISPSGWETYADGTDRYLKGAAGGADGGTTAASQLANHTHSVNAHTHGGTSHTHTHANTNNTSGTLSFFAGANAATWISSHNHPVTVGSSTTAALNSASGGTSGQSGALNPPFRRLRLRENTLDFPDLPVGIIGLWRDSLGSIPEKFQLCDGTNGTPDMFGLYPRASDTDIGQSGGNLNAHTHTGASHTHTTTGHSHTRAAGAAATSPVNLASGGVATVLNTHTHTLPDTDAATPSVTNAGTGTLASVTSVEPLHEEVAFVQLMEEWGPPPAPPTFCLEWSDDEHLIRTLTPSGPIYAPVLGKFEWTRDRPFTAATGVNGTRFVTSAAPGGRNLHMVAAVESEEDLATLRAVLARPLVLISPSDASEVWAAPIAESVRIVKVGRIRQVTADFIGTGPEPGPQLADVGE
jgi:hypothetical protein